MGDVAAVRERVQEILGSNFSDLNQEQLVISARNGSARGFVRVTGEGDHEPTIVHIEFPLLFEVAESAELYKYIAEHADDYTFGHLSLARDEGAFTIAFTHRLLGDYLDDDELLVAFRWMGHIADDVDDQLQAQFGGERYHEA